MDSFLKDDIERRCLERGIGQAYLLWQRLLNAPAAEDVVDLDATLPVVGDGDGLLWELHAAGGKTRLHPFVVREAAERLGIDVSNIR